MKNQLSFIAYCTHHIYTITTEVVSWNPAHGDVYSIQHYMIKFVSDSQHVSVFFPGTPVSSNKADCHDIAEI
jgi:hypothetical protein